MKDRRESFKFFTNMVTGKDNITYDIVRWLGFLGAIVMLVLEIYTVLTTGLFDIINFGTGYTLLLSGIGVGVKLKESSEPE